MGDEEEEEVEEEVAEEEAAEEEAAKEEADEEVAEGEEDNEDGPIDPCVSCCLGLILFPFALFMLGYNERSYVCTNNQLQSLSGRAVEATCSTPPAAGQVFFFSCPMDKDSFPQWRVEDFALDGNADGNFSSFIWESPSAQLDAKVKQCKETSTTNERGVKVYQHKVEYVDSGRFKKPTQCSQAQQSSRCGPRACQSFTPGWSSARLDALEVAADAYTLPQSLISLLVVFENIDQEMYPTGSCGSKEIGCEKVQALKSTSTHVSVFSKAKDANGNLEKIDFPTFWGCDASETWFLVEGMATMDKQTALMSLENSNSISTWIIRIIGTLLSILGVNCMLSPIASAAEAAGNLLSNIPCVGGFLEDAIEGVVTTVLCTISIGVGCCCSLFTISIFWLFLRPLYGGAALGVSLCCCGAVIAFRNSSGAPNKGKRKEKRE